MIAQILLVFLLAPISVFAQQNIIENSKAVAMGKHLKRLAVLERDLSGLARSSTCASGSDCELLKVVGTECGDILYYPVGRNDFSTAQSKYNEIFDIAKKIFFIQTGHLYGIEDAVCGLALPKTPKVGCLKERAKAAGRCILTSGPADTYGEACPVGTKSCSEPECIKNIYGQKNWLNPNYKNTGLCLLDVKNKDFQFMEKSEAKAKEEDEVFQKHLEESVM